MYFGNIHNMSFVPVTFGNFFFSSPPKMAHFGQNWEESKWPGHFSSTFLNFFASKIGVKLPPEKKVPWHRCGPARARGSNCHFFQKNAFFRQKNGFFQKILIQSKVNIFHQIQPTHITIQYMYVLYFLFLVIQCLFTKIQYLLSVCRQHGDDTRVTELC